MMGLTRRGVGWGRIRGFWQRHCYLPVISLGGAVLFALLTAFDYQRIKYSTSDETVMVTLNIFLDFVNLFTFILDLFLMFNGGFGSKD
jgi:FtsH-binding integral membrane protein